jgi:fatty acid desaturase
MPEHVSIENQKVQTGELTLRPAKNALIKDRDLHLGNEYAELKRIVKQKALLDQQPIYYIFRMLLTLTLVAGGLAFLLLVNNFWLQLLNAAYLGFVFTQISFFSHDIGHRQVFHTTWKANVGNLVVSNLLLGMSGAWWVDRHNQHHSHPNQFDLDLDIDIPFISFTVEEARSKPKFLRFIAKYQAYFFFPTQVLAILGFKLLSIRFLLQKKAKYPLIEAIFMALHHLLYFGLLLMCLNIWQAVIFMLIQQALFGLYLGSIFAPNHKGMPMLDKDSRLDFLRRQVLTSRNVKAHPLTDFWYGGLNYQIEHHLFPTMPRNKLKEAQIIVRAFCKAHSVAYCETGLLQSYKEILQCLHQTSAPLRKA